MGPRAGSKALGFTGRARAAVERGLTHPTVELGLVALILTSVGLIVAEAAFDRDAPTRLALERIGDAITWMFVFELSLRFVVARSKRRFFRRYWLDIISVLPLVRPLRLFRVVRLLRLFRAGLILNRRIAVFQGVFRRTGTEFTVLGTVTAILVLAASVTLHLGEGRENAAFSQLGEAVWFSVYSLVGSEPIGAEPITELGRGVTLLLMLGGMTVFGMFVGTISAAMMSRISRRMEVNEMDLDELSGHVIICGWNHSAPVVLQEVLGADQRRVPVVIVTEADDMPPDVPFDHVPREYLYHLQGDFTRVEVLEQAQVGRAAMAILLSDKTVARSDQDRDARTVLAALTAERLAPGIFTCAELRDRQNESLLRMAGVEEIVVADEYSGFIIGSVGRNRGLVRTLDEILSTRYGNAFHKVDVTGELEGRTVAEVHALLKERHNAILVSVESRAENGYQVTVNPPAARQLAEGDQLVVIAPGPIRF